MQCYLLSKRLEVMTLMLVLVIHRLNYFVLQYFFIVVSAYCEMVLVVYCDQQLESTLLVVLVPCSGSPLVLLMRQCGNVMPSLLRVHLEFTGHPVTYATQHRSHQSCFPQPSTSPLAAC